MSHDLKTPHPPSDSAPDDSLSPSSRSIRGNDVVLRRVRDRPDSAPDSALEEYTLERDQNLPLRFRGQLIGWNEIDPAVTRGTAVAIYVTRRGQIITSVHQWQRDDFRDRERHDACVHQTAEAALEWLVQDGGGHLGRASREAWEMACRTWPPLQGKDVEIVE